MGAVALDDILRSPSTGSGDNSDSFSYDPEKKLYLPPSVEKKKPDMKFTPGGGKSDKKAKSDLKYIPGGKSETKPKKSWIQDKNPTLEKILMPSKNKPGLDNKNLDEKSTIGKIATDVAKYGAFLGSQLLIFPFSVVQATMIPATGLAIGSIFDNRKKKQKTTWNRVKPEFYTGNTYGFADYYAFSLPEILMGLTPGLWPVPALTFSLGALPMQFARTAMLETLVLPYNFGYKMYTHFRNKVGLGPAIGGLMTGKIFKHLYDGYQQEIKGKLWKDTVSVWKHLSPLHHFQINHLASTELRLLQSVLINTPIYRFLMRDKTGEGAKSKTPDMSQYKKDDKSGLYKPKNPPGMKMDAKSGLYLPDSMKKKAPVMPQYNNIAA